VCSSWRPTGVPVASISRLSSGVDSQAATRTSTRGSLSASVAAAGQPEWRLEWCQLRVGRKVRHSAWQHQQPWQHHQRRMQGSLAGHTAQSRPGLPSQANLLKQRSPSQQTQYPLHAPPSPTPGAPAAWSPGVPRAPRPSSFARGASCARRSHVAFSRAGEANSGTSSAMRSARRCSGM